MRHKKPRARTQSGFAEESQTPLATPTTSVPTMHEHVELGAGGRLVIPAKMRAALGMVVGDRLNVRLEGSELRIYTYKEGLRRVQEIMQGLVPQGVSLVDELIAERRREAAKEQADD